MRWLPLLAVLTLLGCGKSQDATPATPAAKHDHDHDNDNDHTSGTRMIEHAGPYHACLTSHLSTKDGNELDVFFETLRDANPVGLALDKILAKAKRTGDDKEYDLTFEPAPPNERPKDEKPGTCSHYVAKAPFMKPTDNLTVTMKVVVRDKERTVVWENFDVKKFCHHEDK